MAFVLSLLYSLQDIFLPAKLHLFLVYIFIINYIYLVAFLFCFPKLLTDNSKCQAPLTLKILN